MEKHHWIKPPALKSLNDLSRDEAVEIILNLQQYIDDSLQRRDSFYDNLLLMKTESYENLKKLKTEIKEKVRNLHDIGVQTSTQDCTQNEISRDDNTIEDTEMVMTGQREAFITEVNLTYKGPKASLSTSYGQNPTKKTSDAKIKELEKELLDTKRDLKRKVELDRSRKTLGKETSKDKTNSEKIAEHARQIKILKLKGEEMIRQMDIMRNLVKEYKSKYNEKCQDVENLKEKVKQQALDKMGTKLHVQQDIGRYRKKDDELQKEIIRLENQLREKAEQIETLRKQIGITENQRDSQKMMYENSMVLRKHLQEKVEVLEANKHATNERMKQFGGVIRISLATQTYQDTVNVATNTENSIYNVCGRSLKREDLADNDPMSCFTGPMFRRIRNVKTKFRRDEGTAQAVQTISDMDFSVEKMSTLGDQDKFENSQAFLENLPDEYFRADSSLFEKESFHEGDMSDTSEIKMADTKERGVYTQTKFPKITDSDHFNQTVRKDGQSNPRIKLPNISAPGEKQNIDAGLGNRNVKDAEDLSDGKRMVNRVEQIPSKIGVHEKDGVNNQWKPLVSEDYCITSPQSAVSAPDWSSELSTDCGKTMSGLDSARKDSKLKAVTKKGTGPNKREFMLTTSGPNIKD